MAVTIDDRGMDQFRARLREIGAKTVYIGVLGSGKGNEAHGRVTNVDVATWQEFGTVDEEGNEHVPERSFLRATIPIKKADIEARAATEIRKALAGTQTVEASMGRIGEAVVGMVKRRMAEGIDPPLVSREGTPLIDSGQLRSAITHEVRG